MTVLRDAYDPVWRELDDRKCAEHDEAIRAWAKCPRWRWLHKAVLRAHAGAVQRELRYLREAADEDTRDRLLLARERS